jgi:hypothetical protein
VEAFVAALADAFPDPFFLECRKGCLILGQANTTARVPQ